MEKLSSLFLFLFESWMVFVISSHEGMISWAHGRKKLRKSHQSRKRRADGRLSLDKSHEEDVSLSHGRKTIIARFRSTTVIRH